MSCIRSRRTTARSLRPHTAIQLLCLITVLAAPLLAQAQTGLAGEVRDPSGATVADAVVRARNTVTGRATETETDRAGAYELTLPAGAYRVEVRASSFEPFLSDILAVETGETLTFSPGLRLQSLDQQLVVTASRREEDVLNSAVPTTLINRKAIEDTATQTLEQLLVEQAGSGVYVSRGFGVGFPSINGVGGNRVLVLVDGQRQIGTDNGTRDGIDLDQFTTANIERVEVVKGAASPLYGSDAMGGVIQIFTRNPDEPFYGEIDGNFGSFGEANGSALLGMRQGRFGAVLSGLYQTYDGYDLDDRPGTSGLAGGENAFIDRKVSPSLFYDFTDTAKLRVSSNFYRRNSNFVAANGFDEIDSIQERWNVSPNFEAAVGGNTLVNLRGDYSTARRFDAARVETLGQFEAVGSTQTSALNTLQYGYDFRRKELTRPGLGSADDITIPLGDQGSRTVNVNSLWAQDELRLFRNRLTLSGGFRYENNSQFGGNFSPKAGAVLRLTKQQNLRFSYGEGFRAPDVSELYREFANSGFFAFVGNPELTPEQSRSYSAGWTFFHPRVRYSLDFFYNQFENGIGFAIIDFDDANTNPFFDQFADLLGGAPLYTNLNLGDYDSRGANSALEFLLPLGFRTTFNYTLLDRVSVDNNGDTGDRLIGLGNVRNSAFLKFAWGDDFRAGSRTWSLNTNLRATIRGREALGTTSSFDEPADAGRIGQVEYVPTYHTWDFQLSAEAPLSEKVRLRPYLAVNNIADFIPRGYEYADGALVVHTGDNASTALFREPGRTIKAGLTLRF